MTSTTNASLQAVIYEKKEIRLQVLDQLLVPHEKIYIPIATLEDAWNVIRKMQIRGAPLIAIVACLGLAVDVWTNPKTVQEVKDLPDQQGLLTYLEEKAAYLLTSRPTAVNLANAMEELKLKLEACEQTKECILQTLREYAEFMLDRDLRDNQQIGQHGADAILQANDNDKKVTVMTICNTGSLATSGYGTALGVVRAIHERNLLHQVIALETRPYNQGSRLTAFEIVQDKLPNGMLICDSMAAYRMKTHAVDAVVVGADRVCANGDTANKIGTYALALAAHAHQVPVYVAAPFTTLDVNLPHGDYIPIEERPPHELLSTSQAPEDISVWNPAFDVTPAKYLEGIITEHGVIRKGPDGKIDVKGFVQKHTAGTMGAPSAEKVEKPKLFVPFDYQEQSAASVPSYLAKHSAKTMEILEANDVGDLEATEMGDGNLNLVFIVTNKKNQKKVIVKQALPYVRCVGESWPMTLDRAYYEFRALTVEKEACPDYVPSIFHFSKANGLMAMQYIQPPNIILRKGLIQGIRYPRMARDMGSFCAQTLFKTSGFKLSPTELRNNVEFWSTNVEMCALTEQVIFTEPYTQASNNRWTSPQLDEDKRIVEENSALKMAASRFKRKFVTETQALIHGDLHSGSVMCSEDETFVIDPEFAFYGPKGFDTGLFVGNLMLAYVSQAGHSNGPDYAEWILQQIVEFWNSFCAEFCALWNNPKEHTGFLYGREISSNLSWNLDQCQKNYLEELLHDTLGFAGMEMLRRIVGIAHVEDLESISDIDVRSRCERHGLDIACHLIEASNNMFRMEDVVGMARSKKDAKVGSA